MVGSAFVVDDEAEPAVRAADIDREASGLYMAGQGTHTVTHVVDIADSDFVRLTTVEVETAPETISFHVEGMIGASTDLLSPFAGTQLAPETIRFAVDDRTVSVDVDDHAELRLESIDVGVQLVDDASVSSLTAGDVLPDADTPPDATDVIPDTDGSDLLDSATGELDPLSAGDSPASEVGRLSFTVDGNIDGVDADTLDSLAAESVTIDAIEFAVDDVPRSDGGDPEPEPLLDVRVLGYGLTVWPDGRLWVRR